MRDGANIIIFSVGMLCVADAVLCVWLGHSDWVQPAGLALGIGLMMRRA